MYFNVVIYFLKDVQLCSLESIWGIIFLLKFSRMELIRRGRWFGYGLMSGVYECVYVCVAFCLFTYPCFISPTLQHASSLDDVAR